MTLKIKKLVCLFMTLCVILLSACTTANNQEKRDQTPQSLYMMSQKAICLPGEGNGVIGESRPLKWRVIPIAVTSEWVTEKQEIQLMTVEYTSQMIEELFLLHKYCEDEEEKLHKEIGQLSYTESYFETNSLLLIPITVDVGCKYNIIDVRYNDDKLEVLAEYLTPTDDTTQAAAFSSYCLFLEIGEVIPSSIPVCLDVQLKKYENLMGKDVKANIF